MSVGYVLSTDVGQFEIPTYGCIYSQQMTAECQLKVLEMRNVDQIERILSIVSNHIFESEVFLAHYHAYGKYCSWNLSDLHFVIDRKVDLKLSFMFCKKNFCEEFQKFIINHKSEYIDDFCYACLNPIPEVAAYLKVVSL